jgi:hypothetical protein
MTVFTVTIGSSIMNITHSLDDCETAFMCFVVCVLFKNRTRLARRVPLVEKELLTLPEHLSSSPSFSGVRATRSLLLCVVFCSSLFVLSYFFLLTIVLSVVLRFTDSDYLFGIFKGPSWSWSYGSLVEETGVPGKDHRPTESHWQTLSHNVVSSTPRHYLIRTHNLHS